MPRVRSSTRAQPAAAARRVRLRRVQVGMYPADMPLSMPAPNTTMDVPWLVSRRILPTNPGLESSGDWTGHDHAASEPPSARGRRGPTRAPELVQESALTPDPHQAPRHPYL